MSFIFVFLFGTIHGFVRAAESKEPVPYATVEVLGAKRATQADEHGYYVLSGIASGNYRVVASGLGFRPDTLVVEVGSEQSVMANFGLSQAPVALPAIAATVGSGGDIVSSSAGPAPIRVTAEAISQLPSLAEPDVFRAVQRLPAFSPASDFSTALYVRGSSPEETLVSLDGAALFNPYHLGGLFAAVDPSAVAVLEARAGALPADAPDRLAGSVEIFTKEGGRDRVRSTGSIGLVSSRASVDGPLPGGNGSFLASARLTYLDLLTGAAAAVGAIEEGFPYGFHDAHLKLSRDVGDSGVLSASLYKNREALMHQGPDSVRADWAWGTRAGSLTYRGRFGSFATISMTAAASHFDALLVGRGSRSSRQEAGAAAARFATSVSDVANATIKGTVFLRGSSHSFQAGLEYQRFWTDHEIDSQWEAFDHILPPLTEHATFTTQAAFIEDEWLANERLTVRGGVRLLRADNRHVVILPRFGFRYRLDRNLFATLGGGRYAQAVRSLRNEEARLASIFAYDLYTGIPPDWPLPKSEDLVAGVEWSGPAASVRLEGYGKRLWDLPLVPLGGDPATTPVLAAVHDLEAGSGTAVGVELTGNYLGSRYQSSVSYALSSVTYHVGAVEYSPRYWRQNTLDVSFIRWLGRERQGSFVSRLALGSGQPTTPVIGALQPYRYDPATGRLVPTFENKRIYGPHNSGRLAPYLRLDVGIRGTFKREWFGRGVDVTPYLHILNVLNSSNPVWSDVDVFSGVAAEDGPRLPIVPSFGIEWRF